MRWSIDVWEEYLDLPCLPSGWQCTSLHLRCTPWNSSWCHPILSEYRKLFCSWLYLTWYPAQWSSWGPCWRKKDIILSVCCRGYNCETARKICDITWLHLVLQKLLVTTPQNISEWSSVWGCFPSKGHSQIFGLLWSRGRKEMLWR